MTELPRQSDVWEAFYRGGSQHLYESFHGEVCLSQNRAQRASRQLVMQWDDHDLPCGVPQLQVAAALTHLGEPNLGQFSHDGAARHDGKPGAHAGISTGAMIGVSM